MLSLGFQAYATMPDLIWGALKVLKPGTYLLIFGFNCFELEF
jgi:hypothetical protein